MKAMTLTFAATIATVLGLVWFPFTTVAIWVLIGSYVWLTRW